MQSLPLGSPSNVCWNSLYTTSREEPPLEHRASKRKAGLRQVFSWWLRSRLLKQVRKALESTAASPPPPRALLEGTGVIVLPSDPVQTACSAFAIRDLCGRLEAPVRLAGSPSSLRWIPSSKTGTPIQTPDPKTSPREFAEWLEYTRAHRGDWSLLAAIHASPVEEAAFAWLGAGGRIATPHACPGGSANILLSAEHSDLPLDDQIRRFLRVVRADLPGPPSVRNPSTGPIVLEIPDDLPEKGGLTRKWADAITKISTTHPILLAHFDPLPSSITELLRGIGSRVAITHLPNADDAIDLAGRARVWIGPRSPTTALAALSGCPVKLVGGQKASEGYPQSAVSTISGKIVWQGSLEGV